MRIKYHSLIICVLILVTCAVVWSQRMFDRPAVRNQENVFGRSLFQLGIYNFADIDQKLSRVEFHCQFVNDILTFIKEDEGIYRARYEIIVEALDKKRNPLTDTSVSGEIAVNSFDQTNSRLTFVREKLALSLAPGKYKFKLRLIDLETKKSLVRERELELRDFFTSRLHTSDIMFVDKIQVDNENNMKIFPNIEARFSTPESDFAAYFEVYPPAEADSLTIVYKIYDKRKKVVAKHEGHYANEFPVYRHILKLRENVKKPGTYFLVVEVRVGKSKATLRRKFYVQWGKVSLDTNNIAIAIEPLAIIANKQDIRAMENASESERRELFEEFWKKRDPTPNSERNELKEEFFRRLDFANQNFSLLAAGIEGWQTDRGKVYIQYGPPTEVERQPTDINMPTAEIWYYQKIDRHFIFSDPSGTGNYRLVRVE